MSAFFKDIYRGKRVFITGHTGFKGSWLSLWLSHLGAEVIGYSLDIPTTPSHFEILNLDITSLTGDILDKEKLNAAIKKYQPDVVFHLAAQPLVRDSYVYPVKTFETNVLGTVNVLESCRHAASVRAILNITSDKCYENKEWARAYREGDPLGGHDPYSASKAAAEIVANSYRTSFFHQDKFGSHHSTLLADVRAGNVIGGGDWAKDRLIPDIMRAASKNEEVVIRMPHSTRPWQHVLEPLSGYLYLGWRLLEGRKDLAENWNFGPNKESHLTVKEILEHAKKRWSSVTYRIEENPEHPHEAGLLALDSTKARTKLGWRSVWNIEMTFEKTMQWYQNYYQNNIVQSVRDLESYSHDARIAKLDWANT